MHLTHRNDDSEPQRAQHEDAVRVLIPPAELRGLHLDATFELLAARPTREAPTDAEGRIAPGAEEEVIAVFEVPVSPPPRPLALRMWAITRSDGGPEQPVPGTEVTVELSPRMVGPLPGGSATPAPPRAQ